MVKKNMAFPYKVSWFYKDRRESCYHLIQKVLTMFIPYPNLLGSSPMSNMMHKVQLFCCCLNKSQVHSGISYHTSSKLCKRNYLDGSSHWLKSYDQYALLPTIAYTIRVSLIHNSSQFVLMTLLLYIKLSCPIIQPW